MQLSEIKEILSNLSYITFVLPNGKAVDSHFHVTEIGSVSKHFVDCGGTVRKEDVINFQLWNADDYDHRLHPEKLLHIINVSENVLGLKDGTIEVEYQGDTIQKFGLDFDGKQFLLTAKHTDCLAKDKCGVPAIASIKERLKTIQQETTTCCAPNSGCC